MRMQNLLSNHGNGIKQDNPDPLKSIMSGHTHTLSSLNTYSDIPINTLDHEYLYYNPIKEVSKEFDEYKNNKETKKD